MNINETIINLRFDVLNNSYSITQIDIINFIINNIDKEITKNIFFIKETECIVVNNIYIGNINTMYKLIYKFNKKL